MKKNVPLLICVQSKNNLSSLSTAHWGRLVKESVSKERESKCCGVPNKKKERKRTWKEGGIKMENGTQVGGKKQNESKERQRWKSAGKDVGQMNPREWVHEALETAEWIRLPCCQLFPLATPVSQSGWMQCHYTPIWPQGFCESWCSNKNT